MVINMKRKRREECPSPLLDDSPKRTKVHAQRKFAQGTNPSPVLAPVVQEIESPEADIVPEPVELLPIKRPNTEDFLTFLCFRGTPILPPNLNFFNTASIVDTNGQVHGLKSESPKNGPIDTCSISKTGSGSSERPFIAFGVRKRADPIVISRQMDKKRRHALALQALRRKYQEQKMAKIRSVTISKLSEKPKTLLRSNSLPKNETLTKKTPTVPKPRPEILVKELSKVDTRSVKALRPQIKQKMCLRSFRGRFVQKELQFRNVKKRAPMPVKKLKKEEEKKDESDYSSDDERPLSKSNEKVKVPKVVVAKKNAPGPKKPAEINFRITRSNKFLNSKIVLRRQQIKKRMLLTTPTIIKPRTLRSQTAQKSRIIPETTKQKILIKGKKGIGNQKKEAKREPLPIAKKQSTKATENAKGDNKESAKREEGSLKDKKEAKASENVKKVVNKSANDPLKKAVSPTPAPKTRTESKPPAVKKEPSNVKKEPSSLKKDAASVKKEPDGAKKKMAPKQTPEKPEPVKAQQEIKKKPIVPPKKGTPKSADKKETAKVEDRPEERPADKAETVMPQRPTRKTKEAAAIYMEILSHKLVNESRIDDDNVSIDSFPELPNVKKTEQRENELKAKAKSGENDAKKRREPEVAECKVLRSSDKKRPEERRTTKRDTATDEEKVKKIIEEVKRSLAKSEAREEARRSVKEKNAKEEGKKSVRNEEGKKNVKIEVKEEGKKSPKNETKEEPKKSVKSEAKEEEKKGVKEEGKKNEDGKKPLKHEEKEEVKKTVKSEKDEAKKTVKVEVKEEPKKSIKEEAKKIVKGEVKEEVCDRKTRSANQEKNPDKAVTSPPPERTKEAELKVQVSSTDAEPDMKPKIDTKKKPDEVKEEVKPPVEDPKKTVAEAEPKKPTKRKSEEKKCDGAASSDASEAKRPRTRTDTPETTRRQTRNSAQNVRQQQQHHQAHSDDSDESFRADIRIPRKKPLTRSKARSEGKECVSSSSDDSDQSTTSDANPARPRSSGKNKKFTKTRPAVRQQREELSFSDSDEEPLSKLTQNRPKAKEGGEGGAKEEGEEPVKPKRECAKRPQNYLPMFSSSEEEEMYFQVFKEGIKARKAEPCSHLPPTSDLSCKDVGRRFGKGKVNMSTEQIEKWLKDSAMAGISVKNENDAMLKFGEKIPTETSHSVATFIDTDHLKKLLIPEDKIEKKEMKIDPDKMAKVTPIDRKLIFRNKAKGSGVNVKAFSASNEKSVYAFEETEDLMKTPFRRPARRPSSTATSRSEDEVKLEELPKSTQFRRPLVKQEKSKEPEEEKPEETNFNRPKNVVAGGQKTERKTLMTGMTPPAKAHLDDAKYKIPSSPSASSSSSAKLSKRQTAGGKYRACDVLPVKLPDFPAGGACLVEAPTFHPTEREFQDPLEYIEKIRARAEQFGICRIVPPAAFKPECKVTDDMRFTAYNQYVHKMLHRWGPNFKELMAIKRYLSTQNISLTHPPWIGGMEIDLPRLYQTVQSLGGLKEVIEKKKWPKVSDMMKIPKSAQDRVTKLDDIYCKYLLPYDTLSPAEREKLFDEVETEWAKRESRSLLKAQQNVDDNSADAESESDDEAEECIVKGRSMALNAFYRIARNTMSMWFKNPEPPAEEVEHEFWKHVTQKQNHICVHSGSIDSGNWGYGFAVSKNSPFARHAWNLKVLTNNSGSVLRAMGPVMGVTVPTLHVGMVFSSCCWYRDPHSLPWIEYLHTGGSKIWYGVPSSTGASFHSALKSLVPNYCRNKSLWLPSDTVMVPPSLLVENGVSLCRIVQEPGQFVVVFPKVFTSSLSTGYVVSESVYFAPPNWLRTGRTVFDELRNSCESSMFSFDRLLLSIVDDSRSSVEVLKQIIPAAQELCDKEKAAREWLKAAGVTATEKLPLPEAPQVRKKKKMQSEDGEYECEICRMNLFVSMVSESQDDAVYCLDHAVEQIEKKKIQSKHCKLEYTYDEQELEGLVERIKTAISNKLQKKVPSRFTGMPTLLK